VTSGTSTGELTRELDVQRRAWDERPLVRALYRDWYARMAALLADGDGPTVEIGAGIGTLKEVIPDVIATDVQATPWTDRVVDAQELPYANGELDNLVGVDVLHHLPRPLRFLQEARRTLRPGGRLVLLEPYGSAASTLSYRFLHHEDWDPRADPFADVAHSSDRPLDANGALPTLLFFRRADELRRRLPELEIVHRERLAVLAYPLSGGFTRRPLVPERATRRLLALERRLAPLAPALAFRCLVALQRA
jgi:SAM-dependent methyltransferase